MVLSNSTFFLSRCLDDSTWLKFFFDSEADGWEWVGPPEDVNKSLRGFENRLENPEMAASLVSLLIFAESVKLGDEELLFCDEMYVLAAATPSAVCVMQVIIWGTYA